ncbi:hypothetical protein SAMN04487944_101198 [Gracilibacillus ureilyticus]|uniref:DUF5659 domain-containing protein n=1 Tax=Gracilibacillus ureilyticus TaxID=531814 RepID=A0A1H9LDZ4_9BACI|nr:hypothetical protein [Gracilibacillus ureilyticus]SER09163.1 hypothetical protein SAMN04487944_101198 [Gracilibacillus ureilyticus]
MKKENNYFFCYSKDLSNFLKANGISYITKSINPKNKLTFTLFEKDNQLISTLKDYKVQNQ